MRLATKTVHLLTGLGLWTIACAAVAADQIDTATAARDSARVVIANRTVIVVRAFKTRKELAQYYETVVARLGSQPKLAANWVMGELSGALNRDNLDVAGSKVTAEALAGLLTRIVDDTISGKIAKEVFEAMWTEGKDADAIIESRGLRQITDSSAIERAIEAVMAANPAQLADYRAGKEKLFGFFVGQVMKATQGKANPAQLNELLRQKLKG